MKKLVLLFFFMQIYFVPCKADIYKKMKCLANLKVLTKGPRGNMSFKSGSFEVIEDKSQVMSLVDEKGKVLAKIYPWYGVDFKFSKLIDSPEKKSSSTDFSLMFIEKKTKKSRSLVCRKY